MKSKPPTGKAARSILVFRSAVINKRGKLKIPFVPPNRQDTSEARNEEVCEKCSCSSRRRRSRQSRARLAKMILSPHRTMAVMLAINQWSTKERKLLRCTALKNLLRGVLKKTLHSRQAPPPRHVNEQTIRRAYQSASLTACRRKPRPTKSRSVTITTWGFRMNLRAINRRFKLARYKADNKNHKISLITTYKHNTCKFLPKLLTPLEQMSLQLRRKSPEVSAKTRRAKLTGQEKILMLYQSANSPSMNKPPLRMKSNYESKPKRIRKHFKFRMSILC